MKLVRCRLIILAGVMLSMVPARPAFCAKDVLFEAFQNPPAEARPFTRWWWCENAVTEEEIVRQVEAMHQAGIGGFEINPISSPVRVDLSSPSHRWLSPELNRLMRVAADAARERGMIADLIVGSGWPFGAEFVEAGNMTKRFYVKTVTVKGPTTYRASMAKLKAPPPVRNKRAWRGAPDPECLFIHLAPAGAKDITSIKDITDAVTADNMLVVEVPKGAHTIHLGVMHEGFSQVHNGSPGAMGPVLDHYKAEALEGFLETMSSKLGPAMGGKLGDSIRAVFCDSIELSAANWTTDLPQQFKKRRGYDVLPYLAFVQDFNKPIRGADAWADRLRRVRYDYARTLVELFHERFIDVYHRWCNRNSCLSRYQAYGSPWLMGMLDGYLVPDIPETNNWLFSNPDRHGFLVWSKYCSSAGNIRGRRIISTEAMTNTRGVFRATLDRIKAADDMNFIMGLTHSVLHGTTYAPPKDGFLHLVRYGTYFNEQNTWWPYLRKWTDYNARLSAVFQESKPVAAVAILGPEADIWSEHGLERDPFHSQPWYVAQLWKAFSHCGVNADHISEAVLQDAACKQGALQCGEMRYDLLVLAGVRTLQPDSAENILKFADAGGKILLLDKLPERAPSLQDLGEGDAKVRDAIKAAIAKHSDRVIHVPAPSKPGELMSHADQWLDRFAVQRDMRIKPLDMRLWQTHRRVGDRDLFFLVNDDAKATLTFTAQLDCPGKMVWHWDPETGKRTVYAADATKPLSIELPPHGSLLLVCETSDATAELPATLAQPAAASPGLKLAGPWTAAFEPAQGKPFKKDAFGLVDLGSSKDAQLNRFAGVVTYRTRFEVKDIKNASTLDLGEVYDISEVTLNGKALGTRWYGRHRYDIREAVKPGENQLEVKVTTVLLNYARTLKANNCGAFWAKRAARDGPAKAGLVGPVEVR